MSNVGKDFEKQFKTSCIERGIYIERFNDSASSFRQGEFLRFSLKPPYDFIAYKYPNALCMELKSVQNGSLNFTLDLKEKGTFKIKAHQIKNLNKASEYKGVISGIVFNFRDSVKTYFLNIKDFMRFANETTKKSINEKDVIKYNGIIIPQEIKRVKYDYNVDVIFDNFVLE